MLVPAVNGAPGAAHVVPGTSKLFSVACSVSRCVAIGALNRRAGATCRRGRLSREPGPANLDACKNGGWQSLNNPVLKNLGHCVSS